MTGGDTDWSEDDLWVYSRLADIAEPSRREQMAALITQIRFETTDAFKLVDLACDEGGLTKAILTLYPRARATALDGSHSMLTVAPINLAEFEDRTETGVFDITAEDWLHQIDGVDLVVSSLVIHHLDSTGKPRLYRNVFNRIAERGALLVVDIVAGRRPSVWSLHADLFDRIAYEQSMTATDSTELYDIVQKEWNIFIYPQESEMPDTIFDNLNWLEGAGFQDVDCLCLRAGYAVFGGHKSA